MALDASSTAAVVSTAATKTRSRATKTTARAVLGGLDMLAFTAGVGENSAPLRGRICAALAWLDVQIDSDANLANASTISRPTSRVRVAVEPTNEEWMAACHAVQTLRGGASVPEGANR